MQTRREFQAILVNPGADEFQYAVVSSVALSCLLTMDFVPGSKPPPIHEMVRHELPRVLDVVSKTQRLGPVDVELHRGYTDDPATLLVEVTRHIGDFPKATRAVLDHGHEDMVFSALQYTRKPPTATESRLQKVTRDVAVALKVDIPNEFHEFVGDAYDIVHGSIIKV
jgi:hypothetical protein